MQFSWKYFVLALSELTATALLMCLGCFSVFSTDIWQEHHFGIAASFGLNVMIVVYIFGPKSGAHLNTWISLSDWIVGAMKWDLCLIYCVSQIIGALVGYSLLYFLIPEKIFFEDDGFCSSRAQPDVSLVKFIIGEFIATGTLIFAYLGENDKRNSYHEGVAVRFGFFITGLIICEGHLTGTSMNFARTLAPIIWHGGWDELLYYFLVQLVATVSVGLLWRFVFMNPFEQAQLKMETGK